MPDLARTLPFEPNRQRIIFDAVTGDVINDPSPSIMYGDPDAIGERDLAELLTIPDFSDDDAEPSDHNIFDMLVPGCPARTEGLSCEPAGGIGPCRHCGKVVG
jgi:hypothetical protein